MTVDLRARAYVFSVTCLGLALLLFSLFFLSSTDWQGLLIFAMLCGLAQSMPIYLFRSSAVSVAFAITFAGLVLFGPIAALWINFGSSAVAAFRPKRKPVHKTLFNISNHALAVGAASIVYLASGGAIQPEQPLLVILPTLLAGVTYFFMQTLLLAGAISLTEHTPFLQTWEANFRWSVFNFVSLALIGLGLALGERSLGHLGILIFTVPLVLAWYSFRSYMTKSREVRLQNETIKLTNEKLEESYVSTIRALAAAVDAKDHYTHGHSETTMRYAVAMARELGLGEDEVAVVEVAALFHDVGKIGVSDAILNKPEQLADEEWNVIKEHPVIGANLIQQVDSLAAVVPGILYHHERYDGKGYPSGLKGDQIPLTAQIVAVADAFQAMTSTRPYRRAFSREHALRELKRCAGTQFSPAVVDAFFRAVRVGHAPEEVTLPNPLRLFRRQEATIDVR